MIKKFAPPGSAAFLSAIYTWFLIRTSKGSNSPRYRSFPRRSSRRRRARMPKKVQAMVIGAGISGLAAAYHLQKARVDTLLVDAAHRPGGVIYSLARDGYLVECGPQRFSRPHELTA